MAAMRSSGLKIFPHEPVFTFITFTSQKLLRGRLPAGLIRDQSIVFGVTGRSAPFGEASVTGVGSAGCDPIAPSKPFWVLSFAFSLAFRMDLVTFVALLTNSCL